MTTETITGNVTSPPSAQYSVYRKYEFGDGLFFREFFKFGSNLNLLSWSFVADPHDTTHMNTGLVDYGPSTVGESTVFIPPSDIPLVWPTAIQVVTTAFAPETGSMTLPSLSFQGVDVYTITLAQATGHTPV
ncbi:unnamed protein product [Ambrosiozyma monospora]|uniref:Unnamed protein product n=1 Tax=Ambrosiozyma monospora TaxID=43982 RepID=A0ACB5T267_AMBMO|nr:unnamed protein product [Ambrosiozyma monospora]